jgi:fatty-acyl-CoA synthase
LSWTETGRRSNNLGRALLARGARPGDHLAFYMRNRPEYVELLAAAFKARLVHVNVNYRYMPDEVHYIFDNSDARIIVYGSEFRATIEAIRHRLDKVALFVEIDGDGNAAPFAERYETLAVEGDGSPLDLARSPDDLLLIYTGGTTGMPKGVMWTHHDLRESQLVAARLLGPVPETVPALAQSIRQIGPGTKMIPVCPLMHGTGLLVTLATMMAGGCVITLDNPSFEAEALWDAVARHRPDSMAIVGDAFAKPMLRALDAAPGDRDLSSLQRIISSGVMWSLEVKRGLLEHMPQAMLNDGFSSSEALGMGASVMAKGVEAPTAKFMIGERCKVFDENDQPVEPGSGVPGMVAIGGLNPLGYYKDEAKTARTFRTIGGVRYSIPGDWVLVGADGSLTLLGRGNACINTAGEKVFPEEVEEALKTHPSVEDALVVGLPDEKWGQAVTGVIQLAEGHELDEAALRGHVRRSLAGYKTPKRIFIADRSLRAANGKADYPAAKAAAEQAASQDVG